MYALNFSVCGVFDTINEIRYLERNLSLLILIGNRMVYLVIYS